MKKRKQILAWIGIILLVAMYLCTLIFSLMKSDAAYGLFRASVACTIIIPVLLYAYILIYRVLNKNNDNKKPDNRK